MGWPGRRQTTTERGRRGEDIAARWLREHGYRILERNYRRRFGEVDIIARHRDALVFIEVKSRGSSRFGTPLDSITPEKQRRLVMVAQDYLCRHGGSEQPCRFDVLAIETGPDGNPRVQLVENAFQAEGEW